MSQFPGYFQGRRIAPEICLLHGVVHEIVQLGDTRHVRQSQAPPLGYQCAHTKPFASPVLKECGLIFDQHPGSDRRFAALRSWEQALP